MLKKAAVIIPFYKDNLSEYETIALKQCESILSAHPKIAIKPRSLKLPNDTNFLSLSDVISFDDSYFKSLAGYNRLMLASEFYHKFLEYEYILIYQMDSFVFKDELHNWCNQGWDYIGAPWIKKLYHKNPIELFFLNTKNYFSYRFDNQNQEIPNQYQLNNKVGNGGFSLRKVSTFHNVCIVMKPLIDFYLNQETNYYNEDVFWSIEVNRESRVLNIPTCSVGLKFAFEVPPVKVHKLKDLPFGCHDWDRYADYWRPIFKNYGYEI